MGELFARRSQMSPDLHRSRKLALIRCRCSVAGTKPGRHPIGPANGDAGAPRPANVNAVGAGVVINSTTSVLRRAAIHGSQCNSKK